MKLDLNIDQLASRGRRAVPVDYDIVRPLTEADMALMAIADAGSKPPELKRITDRHHQLARLLASGMKPGEAALQVGYDVSRVSILMNSPAFLELLALYRKEARQEFVSVLEHMAGISRDAALELRERLEESPERFTVSELRQLLNDMQDRVMAGGIEAKDLPEIIELVAPNVLQSDD